MPERWNLRRRNNNTAATDHSPTSLADLPLFTTPPPEDRAADATPAAPTTNRRSAAAAGAPTGAAATTVIDLTTDTDQDTSTHARLAQATRSTPRPGPARPSRTATQRNTPLPEQPADDAVDQVPTAKAAAPLAPSVPAEAPLLHTPEHDTYNSDYIDWSLVSAYRNKASSILSERLKERPGIKREDEVELGRSVVRELIIDQTAADASTGGQLQSADAERALARAIMHSLFGIGRLQAHVEDPTVEDIEAFGNDHVVVLRSNGAIDRVGSIADSDEQLIEDIAFWGSQSPDGERPFSPFHPELQLAIGKQARLHAVAWDTPRPVVRIRIHRHIHSTLDDLEQMGEMDTTIRDFLTAAVAAGRSIVVSGAMGSGKTTLVRALARAIPAHENYATLESVEELFLHIADQRVRPHAPHSERLGSGEIGPDGRVVGERTMAQQFKGALRMNVNRVIVGEVRGAEIGAMFSAMRSGSGSISTIHAKSGKDTADRLATLLEIESGAGMNLRSAYGQVAQHIDLIVHLSTRRDPVTGRRYRFVSEIVEVLPGDHTDNGTQIEHIFKPGPDKRAVPEHQPSFIDDLVEQGFNRSLIDNRRANWRVGMEDLR